MTEKNPPHPSRILNSWKEIASYLRCGARTVQRYERDQQLPVRRPRGKSRSAVIALSDEVDAWARNVALSQAAKGRNTDLTTLAGTVRDAIAQGKQIRQQSSAYRRAHLEALTSLISKLTAMTRDCDHGSLTDLQVLQKLLDVSSADSNSNSSERIHDRTIEALYETIVDAAVRIMRSDFASVQMLFPKRGRGGELRLLSFRGFNPQAARFWEWVRADSKSTCGLALLTKKRAVAPNIASCEFMADSEDQKVYLQTGIKACQTTPLIARSGKTVGMISTHWRTPYMPSECDFRLFGTLANQAADLIEHTRDESV